MVFWWFGFVVVGTLCGCADCDLVMIVVWLAVGLWTGGGVFVLGFWICVGYSCALGFAVFFGGQWVGP